VKQHKMEQKRKQQELKQKKVSKHLCALHDWSSTSSDTSVGKMVVGFQNVSAFICSTFTVQIIAYKPDYCCY
jgi:hypothetical protein